MTSTFIQHFERQAEESFWLKSFDYSKWKSRAKNLLKDYLSKGCVFEVLRKRRFEVNVNQTKKVGEWRLLNGILNQDIIELMAKKPLYFKIWKRITSTFAKSTLLREANIQQQRYDSHDNIFEFANISWKEEVSVYLHFCISRVLVSILKEVLTFRPL